MTNLNSDFLQLGNCYVCNHPVDNHDNDLCYSRVKYEPGLADCCDCSQYLEDYILGSLMLDEIISIYAKEGVCEI